MIHSPAIAGGKLDGRYELTLAGVNVGRAAVVLEVSDDGYAAAGSAWVSGVARALSSGQGTAAVRGNIASGKVVPLSFSMTSEGEKRSDEVRIAMAAGSVRDFSAVPPPSKAPDRVPLADEHRKGVVDPMSAALMIVATGNVVGPSACARTLPVFDGRYRYDVELSFDRIEEVSGAKGYSGPAVVCKAAYKAIAGHRPSHEQKNFARSDDIRIWLVPLPGTRALVPYRVSVGTFFGTFVLQATVFTTTVIERTSSARSP